jgi:hypothetical protein
MSGQYPGYQSPAGHHFGGQMIMGKKLNRAIEIPGIPNITSLNRRL